MSTIQASNISDGTDTVGTEYVINGSAKSWVNFDGTGTVSIRESFNVSSITDNGTGDYTVNFVTNMNVSGYAAVANAAFIGGNEGSAGVKEQSVSSFRVRTRNLAPQASDYDNISAVVVGGN